MNSYHKPFLLLFILCIKTLTAQASEATRSPLAEKIVQLESLYPNAETFSPFTIADYDASLHETLVSKAYYVNVNFSSVNNIIQNNYPLFEMTIPWNDTTLILQLFPSEIFASSFQVFTSQTNKSAIDYSIGAFYRGIVKGYDESLVAFNFFNDHVSGIVSLPGVGNITITQLKNATTHVIYNDLDLLITNPINCATQETEHFEYKKKEISVNKMLITPCVKIFIEADYEMFLDEGGATQTADYIVGFFNVASTIFFNEGVNTVISEIFVWVSADPYPSGSSFEALDYFTGFRTDFNGDLAHLVTYDDENNGGVAWVDVLCSSYNHAYSNIYNEYNDFPVYSWTVMVFTHEMGHNLGSNHTHNCDWPGGAIDNCYTTEGGCAPGPTPIDGGTIMSYCHLTGDGINFANGFGPLPGAHIFDKINDAACIGECDLPPLNDWPCAATELDVNESCIFLESSNVGAINSVVPSVACDGESEGDVWFQLTVPIEGYVIIETDAGDIIDDMGMKIYHGTCTDLSGYPGGCVADGSGYSELMPGFVVVSAPPGTILFLRLWEVNNDAFGEFSICAYTECTVSINPEALIAEDTILCEGESTTISVGGGVLGSLANWIWYADDCLGTAIATGENLFVTPEVTTTYYVQAMGLCDTTECISVTIEVAPIPEIPVLVIDDCAISTTFIPDAVYTWYFNGEIIDAETSNTLTISESGDYSVIITTYGDCSSESEVVFVECLQSGVNDIKSPDINIYPNPGSGVFNLEINGFTGELSFIIFDIVGSAVEKQNIFITSQQNIVPLHLQLASGVYFLQLMDDVVKAGGVLVVE